MNRTGKRHKLFSHTCCSAELPEALNFFDTHATHHSAFEKLLVWFVKLWRHEILNSRLLQPRWSWLSVGIKNNLAKGSQCTFWCGGPSQCGICQDIGWAEHYQRRLEKMREGLQEIEERHFELLIDGGMAERYWWLDMSFEPG